MCQCGINSAWLWAAECLFDEMKTFANTDIYFLFRSSLIRGGLSSCHCHSDVCFSFCLIVCRRLSPHEHWLCIVGYQRLVLTLMDRWGHDEQELHFIVNHTAHVELRGGWRYWDKCKKKHSNKWNASKLKMFSSYRSAAAEETFSLVDEVASVFLCVNVLTERCPCKVQSTVNWTYWTKTH